MNRTASVILFYCLSCTLILGSAGAQTADDYWPNWRGPAHSGMALKGNPPVHIADNIKWKVKLSGQGQSSPVIWGNKIIFQVVVDTGQSSETPPPPAPPQARQGRRRGRGGSGRGSGPTTVHRFNVVCLDRASGKRLWEQTAMETLPHESHHPTGSFAPYSPVTDGQHIWASFGSRGLYCFDMKGTLIWKKPLVKMSKRNSFGEGSSPGVVGHAVVVVCDHEGASQILAFNKLTGDLLWQKPRDEASAWPTPVGARVNGKWQVITNATNATRAYDLDTGDIVWQSTGQTTNCIPTPIVSGDMVYLLSGYRGSSLQAIRLGKTGNLDGTDAIVWQMSDGTPYVPSGVLCGHRLYFCSSGRNAGEVSCYDVNTGKPIYAKQKLAGMGTLYASFVAASDKIYAVDRDGTVVVFANADTLTVLSTSELGEAVDATPAIAGDELYIKGDTHLYCIAR